MKIDGTVRQTDTLYKACKTMFITLESLPVMLRTVSMHAVARAALNMADCAGIVALSEQAERRLPALWDSYMEIRGKGVNREARLNHVDTLYTELTGMLAPPEKVDTVMVEFYLLYHDRTWDCEVIYVEESEGNLYWTYEDWAGWLGDHYGRAERVVVIGTAATKIERHGVWNGA